VRYASICNDISHVAGRTGMGAVMGSKNLKAIAVRGNAPPDMGNREKLLELSRWMGQNFKTKTNFWQHGTGAAMDYYEASGNLPIRNFAAAGSPRWRGLPPRACTRRATWRRWTAAMDARFGARRR